MASLPVCWFLGLCLTTAIDRVLSTSPDSLLEVGTALGNEQPSTDGIETA